VRKAVEDACVRVADDRDDGGILREMLPEHPGTPRRGRSEVLLARVADSGGLDLLVEVLDVDEARPRPVPGLGERDHELPVRDLSLDEERVALGDVQTSEHHRVRVPPQLVLVQQPSRSGSRDSAGHRAVFITPIAQLAAGISRSGSRR
jgi:hypothetical protein